MTDSAFLFLPSCLPPGQDKVCLPSDILQLNLCNVKGTLESLLSFGEGSQASALSFHLLGFGVFYCTLMLILYLLYRWVLNFSTQAWRNRGTSLLTSVGVGVMMILPLSSSWNSQFYKAQSSVKFQLSNYHAATKVYSAKQYDLHNCDLLVNVLARNNMDSLFSSSHFLLVNFF